MELLKYNRQEGKILLDTELLNNSYYYKIIAKHRQFNNEIDLTDIVVSGKKYITLKDLKVDEIEGLWEITFHFEDEIFMEDDIVSNKMTYYVYNQEALEDCLTMKVLKLKPVDCNEIEVHEEHECETCIQEVFHINALFSIIPLVIKQGKPEDLKKIIDSIEFTCYRCGDCL